jgi:nitroreductase
MTDVGRSAIDLTLFEVLATSRRTSLRMDRERAVPIELVQRLCRLATWAPNHKKTWPWRFAMFTGEGRAELGSTIADALEATGFDDEARLEKYRVKYLRAPAMLVVGSAPAEFDLRTVENRDAVAAGVENLLLGATAAGLASFWSSGVPDADAAVAALAGWEEGTATVAIVYLGWPDGAVAVPERPLPEVVVVDHRRPTE